MSLNDVPPVKRITGTDTRGPFPLNVSGSDIEYVDPAHIVVARVGTDGEATAQTEGVHYDLNATFDSELGRYVSAEIELRLSQDVLAAAEGDTPAEELVAYRRQPLTQVLAIPYNAAFPSVSFTYVLNKLVEIAQELRVEARQAVRLPIQDEGYEAPGRDARKGKVLGFDADTGEPTLKAVRDFGDNAIEIDGFNFTGDGATTSWRLVGVTVPNAAGLLVFVGGAHQVADDDYTISYDGDDTLIGISPAVGLGVEITGHVLGFQAEVQTGPPGPTGATGATGATGETGSAGAQGDAGWSPQFAVVSDGDRRVLQVTSWTGGGGSPPSSPTYVGAAGFTGTIGDAIDIRGPQGTSGAGTGDLLAANNLSDLGSIATALTNLGFSAFVKTLIDDASAAAFATTLGAPLLSAANVFASAQRITVATRQFWFSSSVTDSANKTGVVAGEQYNNATESEGWLTLGYSATNGVNTLRLGGGDGNHNAATQISAYTAPDTATRTGTERLRIPGGGQVQAGVLSASATPDFSYISDTDTGLRRQSPNAQAIVCGGLDMYIFNASGRIYFADNQTDDTAKVATLLGWEHDNGTETEGVQLFYFSAPDASNNNLNIGGGSGTFNAATQVSFYTAATPGVRAGTQRGFFNSSGQFAVVSLGAAATPDFTFSGNTNLGRYRVSADVMADVCNGAAVVTYSATAVTVAPPLLVPAGSASAPGIAASADTNTGVELAGSDVGYLVAGGARIAKWGSSGLSDPSDVPYKRAGKQTIPILAAALIPRTTNGPAPATTEHPTNDVMIYTLDFDKTTSEGAQIVIPMPKSWNESTITFAPIWTAASGTPAETCIWGVRAKALSNDDAIDSSWGTAQTSSDALIATGDVHFGTESAAITIGGSPAEGDLIVVEIYRDVSDTLNADAQLIGFNLYFTDNAANDA